MARRAPPSQPAHAELTAEQMTRGIARLQKVIVQLEAFDPQAVPKRWSDDVSIIEKAIEGALATTFGQGTVEYNRYADAKKLDNGPVTMQLAGWGHGGGRGDDAHEARQYVAEGRLASIQLLQQAVEWLQDELGAAAPAPTTAIQPAARSREHKLRKIFIVHGHDAGAREGMARFIEKLDFEAVILQEQVNQGRTIIEKVEAHGDVGFAVVLLTPDDHGAKTGDAPRPRARQNVIIELGYFIGRLGRSNVCAFTTTNDLDLPTDFAGVVWEQLDGAGAWKQRLAGELEAAGFPIDWNKVMRG